MANLPGRYKFLIDLFAAFTAKQYSGLPGIIQDKAYKLAWYAGGLWRWAAPGDADGNVKATAVYVSDTERISALGKVFATDVEVSSMTSGKYTLAGADGLLGNGSLSEDATSIKSAKPLTLNGATRPAWVGNFAKTLQSGPATALAVFDNGSSDAQDVWVNCYYDSSYKASNSRSDNFPTRLSIGSGAIALLSSITQPTAGNAIVDMTTKWRVSRFGQMKQWATELAQSGRYIKVDDTTIGPSATVKRSLLNGASSAGGFGAVTDPANRWNEVGAKSHTELAGVVTTATNQILTFELYRNGVAVATITTPARSYGTGTPWRLVIKAAVRTAGAAGVVRVLMRFHCTADNANSAASCYATEMTLTGVDLTAAHTWDVVCTIPNDASNQITCQDAEKVG